MSRNLLIFSGSRSKIARMFAHAALVWIFVAAVMGVYLRWQAWGKPPIEFAYRFLTHGHSHVMFLGWAFNALLAGLIRAFLPRVISMVYYQIMLILQVAIAGMAVSFPLQGYKIISIALSSLHLFFAAWLILRLWSDSRAQGPALAAFRWAVVFLFLSALGPFALAYVSAQGEEGTVWYQLAVYFYLHFQYNGWMIMALLALLLEKMPLKGEANTQAVHLIATGALLGYALSALWTEPPWIVYVIAVVGAVLQIMGTLRLGGGWYRSYNWRSVWKRRWAYRFAGMALMAFGLKLLLQLSAIIPSVGEFLFLHRNLLIAYFHLVFIGVVTMLLFAIFLERMWIPQDKTLSIAWWLFSGGFVLTEILLVLPGSFLLPLLICAIAMAAGLFWITRQTIYVEDNQTVY